MRTLILSLLGSVVLLAINAVAIAAGYYHSLALIPTAAAPKPSPGQKPK
jgi:hypothetical protein